MYFFRSLYISINVCIKNSVLNRCFHKIFGADPKLLSLYILMYKMFLDSLEITIYYFIFCLYTKNKNYFLTKFNEYYIEY